MKRVYIASPCAGDAEANAKYARKCMADSLAKGEAPFAPHLLYPQVLDDSNDFDREIAIKAAAAWLDACDVLAIYADRGMSRGVMDELEIAIGIERIHIEFRRLGMASVVFKSQDRQECGAPQSGNDELIRAAAMSWGKLLTDEGDEMI